MILCMSSYPEVSTDATIPGMSSPSYDEFYTHTHGHQILLQIRARFLRSYQRKDPTGTLLPVQHVIWFLHCPVLNVRGIVTCIFTARPDMTISRISVFFL